MSQGSFLVFCWISDYLQKVLISFQTCLCLWSDWLQAPTLLYHQNILPYHQITDHSLVLLSGYNYSSKLSIAPAGRHKHQVLLLFSSVFSLIIDCPGASSLCANPVWCQFQTLRTAQEKCAVATGGWGGNGWTQGLFVTADAPWGISPSSAPCLPNPGHPIQACVVFSSRSAFINFLAVQHLPKGLESALQPTWKRAISHTSKRELALFSLDVSRALKHWKI